MHRRTLLKGALASIPFAFLWRPRIARAGTAVGYGPLVDDPNNVFDLPPGFSYRIISRKGDLMSDGYRTPGKPDGMACFPGAAGTGTIVLMRNHELSTDASLGAAYTSGQTPPPNRYDSTAHGGVTRVVMDAETLEVRSSNLVLYGTMMNCSGGPSPWGWLTCEESVSTSQHGYVFACPTTAESAQPAVRIDAYGRFLHEAAAVDPETYIAYMTEDRADSCFYRFVPASKDTPWQGKLQALRIVGRDTMNTGIGLHVDDAFEIAWIDVDDPTPSDDSIRRTMQARGAAVFMRGEGCAFHDGAVFFTATIGGPLGAGQIFRLDPDGDGGTLTLLAQSEDRSVLDMADNVTVAPWGQLFTCEDGIDDQCIRVVEMDGTVSTFGRNALTGGELTGVCFSPDGRVLFVNIQGAGVTLAITGPFPAPKNPPRDTGTNPDSGSGEDRDPSSDPASPDGNSTITVGGCSTSGGASAIGAAAVVAGAAALTKRR